MDFGISSKLYSHESEATVLGCLLLNSSLMNQISLSAGHFYSQIHGTIYSACQAIHMRKERIDLITLQTELEQRDQLDRVGGFAYLVEIAKNTPSAANFSARGADVYIGYSTIASGMGKKSFRFAKI